MQRREGTLHITLFPISAGRRPVTLVVKEMESFFLMDGGSVFVSPVQGWRAHFHSDEAMLKDAAIGVPPAERLARVPARSRRTEDATTHVEAWLLESGAHVEVMPSAEGDVFMYKRRKFPKMSIEVI